MIEIPPYAPPHVKEYYEPKPLQKRELRWFLVACAACIAFWGGVIYCLGS